MKSFSPMKTIQSWISLLAVVLLLFACSDSLDINFDESESKFISVNVYMTKSFETDADRKKQDTICPGDSLIFLTTISPSKSIRLQRYFWTMDGEIFANEFSFKSTVQEPGIHTLSFVLIDYFGDTLSDNLTLYVANPPKLDTINFIPQTKTQSISPLEIMNFAWNKDDEDSLWQVKYHFVLKEFQSGNTLADTVLEKNSFSYYDGFKPLEKYTWNVQAFNELNQYSDHSIQGEFFTAGNKDESGIAGTFKTTAFDQNTEFDLILLDDERTIAGTYKSFQVNADGSFILKPIPSGHYKLFVYQEKNPDFAPDSVEINVHPQMVQEIPEIVLKDVIRPTINHVESKDTLDIQDTLKFIVQDGGGKLRQSRISVYLESTILTSFSLQGDTLSIVLPSMENSWTYKPLIITVLDSSNNKTTKIYYIKPATTFSEVLE